MLLRNLVAQVIVIASVIITVNGFPQRTSPTEENKIDVPISDQRNQFLLRRIVELMRVPSSKIIQNDSEEMHLQNKIVVDRDVDLHQRPKRRFKRFTCWHSCLGAWSMKNARLKEMRHRISNVNPGIALPIHLTNRIGVPENGEEDGTTEPSIADSEATGSDGEAAATEASETEATETSDAEVTTEATEAEATEASEGEATEASETEAVEGSETEVTTEPSDIEVEAETEAPPAPEDTEDGKEEKNEEKRQAGSIAEGLEDEEYEEISDEDDQDDYIDQAAE